MFALQFSHYSESGILCFLLMTVINTIFLCPVLWYKWPYNRQPWVSVVWQNGRFYYHSDVTVSLYCVGGVIKYLQQRKVINECISKTIPWNWIFGACSASYVSWKSIGPTVDGGTMRLSSYCFLVIGHKMHRKENCITSILNWSF